MELLPFQSGFMRNRSNYYFQGRLGRASWRFFMYSLTKKDGSGGLRGEGLHTCWSDSRRAGGNHYMLPEGWYSSFPTTVLFHEQYIVFSKRFVYLKNLFSQYCAPVYEAYAVMKDR